MPFISPTYGKLSDEELKARAAAFMASAKQARYRIIVGSDSQKHETGGYDFVSALVIHRVGAGGIYFWKREVITKRFALKERMYQEAIMSLQTAEAVADLFKENGIAKYDVEIHVDIGKRGETRDVIAEITGMIRGSGYECKIKPDSFAASKVADRHTWPPTIDIFRGRCMIWNWMLHFLQPPVYRC